MNVCGDLEGPPFCIRCEVPMVKGLAMASDGLHKSWTCGGCGYLLERTERITIELPGGTTWRGSVIE